MEGIEGVSFTEANGISNLTAALGEVLKSLEQTPYNDVVVTDYMSKWVNLKPETIKVLDRDGNVVAAFDEASSDAANGVYNYKWVGTPLCEAKAPIVLEKVAAEDYTAGGDNVIGNTNGDIYKITWNIKDGALYRADNYRMQYEVTVDELEYGFQYNTSYPANGNTDLEYLDENNESKTNDIEVPNVDVPKTDTPIIILPPVQEEDPDPTPTEPAEQPKEEPAEPEEVIEVEEEEPPLADIEEPDVPLADIEELEEEEVPLTDVPKTGDSSNMMLWMMMALLSAAALAGIRIAERKER
jgi:LPXTG-motif cell wall-anchored protein